MNKSIYNPMPINTTLTANQLLKMKKQIIKLYKQMYPEDDEMTMDDLNKDSDAGIIEAYNQLMNFKLTPKGEGKVKKVKKASTNPWILHLGEVRKKNKDLSIGELSKLALSTYNKK
jgi:hypothetical protein